MSNDDVERRVLPASTLGWKVPVAEADWPESFDREGTTWRKGPLTLAQRTGEVQCVEYTAGADEWLILYNE